MTPAETIAAAPIVGAGIAEAAAVVGAGVSRIHTEDRSVTVKRLSEREVRADTALWPLRLVAADNDLAQANRELASSVSKLRAVLAESETLQQDVGVTDAFAEQYRPAIRPRGATSSRRRFSFGPRITSECSP